MRHSAARSKVQQQLSERGFRTQPALFRNARKANSPAGDQVVVIPHKVRLSLRGVVECRAVGDI